MSEQTLDVNIESASSKDSAKEGVSSTQDVSSASSVEKSAPEQGVKSFEDVLRQGLKQSLVKDGESPTPEGKAEASENQQLNETGKKQEVEPVEKEDEQKDQAEEEQLGQEKEHEETVAYDRFQTVVQERQELQEKVKTIEPLAQAQQTLLDYCQNNGLSNQDFVQAMEIAALLKTNPTVAWEKLKPIVEGMGMLTGEKLPPDLQSEVDEGHMDVKFAKELASLRAGQKYQGEVTRLTAKQKQEQAQREFMNSIGKTWSDWDAAKKIKDPDFKPNTNGLWELVNDRLTALATAVGPDGQPMNPVRSPADAVALAEKAYVFVMQTKSKLRPNGKTTRVLSSSSSSQQKGKTALEQPTFEEAIKARALELGASR